MVCIDTPARTLLVNLKGAKSSKISNQKKKIYTPSFFACLGHFDSLTFFLFVQGAGFSSLGNVSWNNERRNMELFMGASNLNREHFMCNWRFF